MEESSARLQRLLETTTNSTRKDDSDFKSDDGNSIESMPYATAATVAAEYTKRIRHLEKELRDAHLLVSEGNAAKHSSATTGVELEKARERIYGKFCLISGAPHTQNSAGADRVCCATRM